MTQAARVWSRCSVAGTPPLLAMLASHFIRTKRKIPVFKPCETNARYANKTVSTAPLKASAPEFLQLSVCLCHRLGLKRLNMGEDKNIESMWDPSLLPETKLIKGWMWKEKRKSEGAERRRRDSCRIHVTRHWQAFQGCTYAAGCT